MKAIGDIIKEGGLMNWKSLKDNKCPKCRSDLKENSQMHKCTNKDCNFFCSHDKFESTVNQLYRPSYRPHTEEENLKALNEL